MPGPSLAFLRVSIAHAPPVELCVDLDRDQPFTQWLLDHDRLDEPIHRLFLDLVQPGARVLDVGSHLGTFTLAAAALGAEVIAVDESEPHVELLRRAAERNGFDGVHVVHGSIGDAWGAGIAPVVTVDDVLEEHGWETLEAIKIDIEGAELVALQGMSRLHARGSRPPIVFESNGAGLSRLGSSVYELKGFVAGLGYQLLQVEPHRPGVLVETDADAVQPECIVDYLALTARPPELGEQWQIQPPFSREQTVLRLLDEAARPGPWYRRYVTRILLDGPHSIRADPLVPAAVEALARDNHWEVRQTFDDPPGEGGHEAAADPEPGGPPEELAAIVLGAALAAPSDEPDRIEELLPEDLILREASFHVRRGELLEVIVDDPLVGSELLRALAGLTAPVLGRVETTSVPLLLSSVGQLVEPGLTVGDNLLMLGGFVGGDVRELRGRLDEVAARAQVVGHLDTPLREVFGTVSVAVRLAITAVLECGEAALLLVDELPPVEGAGGFDAWSARRAAERRAEGIAMVQVRSAEGPSLGDPDRVLWIAGSEIVACGRWNSVRNAVRAERMGLVTA